MKLRSGQDDEWRELWIWGYSMMVLAWIVISPWIPPRFFPWSLKVRPSQFLSQASQRAFINFASGEEKPEAPASSFQKHYRSQRPFLYRKVLVTAIFRAHRFIVGSGALALLLAWFLRSAYYIHFKFEYNFLVPETVETNFAAAAKGHQILLPLSSFLLSLYVIFHLYRFHRIMDHAWQLQGRIYDYAILLSTLLLPYNADPRVQDSLWNIHRHLNLAHVFAYEEVAEGVWNSSRDIKNLRESGLVATESEAQELDEACSRLGVVFVWLSDITNRLVESRIVPYAFAPALLEALTDLVNDIAVFNAETKRTPPGAVANMMQLIADVMCLLTPVMLVHVFHGNDPSSPTYFWPWLGSMVLALFYQGLISLVQALEKPFDDHIDALDPDWALATTERQVFSCLAGWESRNAEPLLPVALPKLRRQKSTPAPTSAVPSQGATVPGGSRPPPPQRLAPAPPNGSESRPAAAMPQSTNGDMDEMIAEAERSLATVQVPMEAMPSETHWVPRDVGELGLEGIPEEAGSIVPRSAIGGTLNMELLQATRAALLVPREITLDDMSLERLETVTARPLRELADALLKTEGSLALEVGAGIGGSASGAAQADNDQGHQLAIFKGQAASGSKESDHIRDVVGNFHKNLKESSDIRAKLAATDSGLFGNASPPPANSRPPRSSPGAASNASVTAAVPRRLDARGGTGAGDRSRSAGRDETGSTEGSI